MANNDAYGSNGWIVREVKQRESITMAWTMGRHLEEDFLLVAVLESTCCLGRQHVWQEQWPSETLALLSVFCLGRQTVC